MFALQQATYSTRFNNLKCWSMLVGRWPIMDSMPAKMTEEQYLEKHGFDLTLDEVRTRETHCIRGHRLSDINTRKNGTGQRLCWVCEAGRRGYVTQTEKIGYTHCINGHALLEGNLVLDNGGTIKRCRKCISSNKRNNTYGKGAGAVYENLLEAIGCCEICGDKESKLVLDHNHESGKLRGLLCDPCNKFLGKLEKRIHMINKYYEYIEERG